MGNAVTPPQAAEALPQAKEIIQQAAGDIPEILSAGGLFFDVVKILLLLIWVGSGFAAQRVLPRLTSYQGLLFPLLQFIALLCGPLVYLLWGLKLLWELLLKKLQKHQTQKHQADLPELLTSTGKVFLTKEGLTALSPDSQMALHQLCLLLSKMLHQNSHDLQIEPAGTGKYQVRLRKGDAFVTLAPLIDRSALNIIFLLKAVCGLNEEEGGRPLKGKFQLRHRNETFDAFFSTLPLAGGEKLGLRLKKLQPLTSLEHSGMEKAAFENLRKILQEGRGLILVSGPSGSGKEKLLSLLLQEINSKTRSACWICCGEEPELTGVSKLSVSPGDQMSGAAMLDSAAEQNTDVIAVSAPLAPMLLPRALAIAATQLVLVGLEVPTIADALQELLARGAVPGQLSSLRALISARVLRKLCPHCASPIPLPPEYRAYFTQTGLSGEHLRNAVGCRECDRTGFDGYTGIYDVLTGDDLAGALSGTTPEQMVQSLRDSGRGTDMLGLQGIAAASRGITSLTEVQNVLYGDR